ncbi:MAG TPA: biopolymer transporter ExbD [Steroidobacteraceae bacterium]|nr:biopolymer transporter ExbD [Steroidobacteraceae bacterium]
MSVGQDSGEEATAIADINTTPLVDIMLVLLIIFLITVPVLKKSYVTLPKAVNIPTQTKPENITLQVDKAGTIYWNGGIINDKQVFFQRIVGEARKVPQPEFHLRGDKEARWEYIGRAIYSLQRGGIVKVGFITEPDPKSIHVTR